jgi:hypothetical protein
MNRTAISPVRNICAASEEYIAGDCAATDNDIRTNSGFHPLSDAKTAATFGQVQNPGAKHKAEAIIEFVADPHLCTINRAGVGPVDSYSTVQIDAIALGLDGAAVERLDQHRGCTIEPHTITIIRDLSRFGKQRMAIREQIDDSRAPKLHRRPPWHFRPWPWPR